MYCCVGKLKPKKSCRFLWHDKNALKGRSGLACLCRGAVIVLVRSIITLVPESMLVREKTKYWFLVILATKPKTKIPSLYRVLMMNDDYTPMEFVIEVLEKFFQKNREEATQIMLHVHQRGVGVCGIYTYDLAETKAMQVMNYARKYEHPLQVQLEKE